MNKSSHDMALDRKEYLMAGSHLPSTVTAHYEAVERVIAAMHQRLDEPLSLQEMAKIAFISEYHFNRVFHHITGVPPCRFLYALRLEAAKRLLLTTQNSVTDVCFEVGYNSLGTFIRRFDELLGLSPGRFRLLAQSSETIANMVMTNSDLLGDNVRSSLHGRVDAPADFRGVIFVGLFETRIPQGKPIVGTVISSAGSYRIAPLTDGQFYLFAAGLAWSKDPRDYFLYESALRGGGQSIWVSNGQVFGSTDLALRRPSLVDPPILLTLPQLLMERNGKNEMKKKALNPHIGRAPMEYPTHQSLVPE